MMNGSRFGWTAQIARLIVAVLAGSLLVSAVGVAIAPRVWGLVNAHDEKAVELPTFTGIAQRSILFDREYRRDHVLRDLVDRDGLAVLDLECADLTSAPIEENRPLGDPRENRQLDGLFVVRVHETPHARRYRHAGSRHQQTSGEDGNDEARQLRRPAEA